MSVNADVSAMIYFRRKSCLSCDAQFFIVSEVTKCKFAGGDGIDQFLDLNSIVVDTAEAGSRALGSLLWGAQLAVGMLYGCTFKMRNKITVEK